MQQLAQGPSQQSRPIPYGPVNLWDMINWSLYQFVWSLDLLDQEIREAMRRDPSSRLSDADTSRLLANVEAISSAFNQIGGLADGRIGTVWAIARKALDVSYASLLHELVALRDDVKRECQFERFYHYSRDKARVVLSVDSDWSDALRAFPSTKKEVIASVDCYALSHNNACVFHCMMVLEHGLAALAKRLRVKFNSNKATWTPIIRNIQDAIEKRVRDLAQPPKGGTPKGPRAAKREKQFLDDCALSAQEFRYFADAWRNHIAHGRADYDEDDARKILEHVRSFMSSLANNIVLKGK